jgi:hypothetical protein
MPCTISRGGAVQKLDRKWLKRGSNKRVNPFKNGVKATQMTLIGVIALYFDLK